MIEDYPDLLKLDGFDEAILGVVERIGLQAICYDTHKVIEILMKDMTEEEAWEYYSYNMLGAYVGESTPVFLELFEGGKSRSDVPQEERL
jgi:hypothetical protein